MNFSPLMTTNIPSTRMNLNKMVGMASSGKVFPTSHEPEKWIEWMIMIACGFAIITIFRLFGNLWIFFFFLLTLLVFIFAIWRRKKLWFGILAICLAICSLMLLILFFKGFKKKFFLKGFFAIVFNLLSLAFCLYAAYCAYRMFKQFPEGLDYSQDNIQPMHREAMGKGPHSAGAGGMGGMQAPGGMDRRMGQGRGLDDGAGAMGGGFGSYGGMGDGGKDEFGGGGFGGGGFGRDGFGENRDSGGYAGRNKNVNALYADYQVDSQSEDDGIEYII
jgi:hypothetical protein